MNNDLAIRAAPWLYTAALFLIWEAAVRIFNVPTFFLPPPTAVAQASLDRSALGAGSVPSDESIADAIPSKSSQERARVVARSF